MVNLSISLAPNNLNKIIIKYRNSQEAYLADVRPAQSHEEEEIHKQKEQVEALESTMEVCQAFLNSELVCQTSQMDGTKRKKAKVLGSLVRRKVLVPKDQKH